MFRIGFSEDIHPTKLGRKLVLGGVEIPSEFGLDGHSDADVVLHSLSEAILGALALGDLGSHFPDNDPTYKDIDSSFIVKEVVRLMEENGYAFSYTGYQEIDMFSNPTGVNVTGPKQITKQGMYLDMTKKQINMILDMMMERKLNF